jgi:hypothetical protein
MSKYAARIKAQFIKNIEERAHAYEATKDERYQLFDEFLNPRKSVIDNLDLIESKKDKKSDINSNFTC